MSRKSVWGVTVRHGTSSGWRRHQKNGERPCDPCFHAKAEYDRRRREEPQHLAEGRARARAQRRAYGKLARKHKDEYDRLYAAEIRALGFTYGGPRAER